MSKMVLKVISDGMKSLGLEYGLGGYAGNAEGDVVYPYFVGEYSETEISSESGLQESTFMLTGFGRGTWLSLEDAVDSIRDYFNRISGKTVIADNGSAVAVFYSTAMIVPTGDAELKRIQINLDVKEWKVN